VTADRLRSAAAAVQRIGRLAAAIEALGATVANNEQIRRLIRTIPDFPKPGIQFRDIASLLQDKWGLKRVVDELVNHYKYSPIDKVVAIESRGFIVGGALANHLQCGFLMARKKGKLPGPVKRHEYKLEYGTDCIEMHTDAVYPGERCLVVDDLLATGGTCDAACRLVEELGGVVVGCAFIINLTNLNGYERIKRYDCHWLVEFEG
jgi:adenine phosphoribosyltransferase